MNRTVLYVQGFSPNLRARDLAYEFERYGRLIRCDIPALKTAQSSPRERTGSMPDSSDTSLEDANEGQIPLDLSPPEPERCRLEFNSLPRFPVAAFAFIEFRREDDAEDAYYDMHGRSIDGYRITVQWAKRPPSNNWRHDACSTLAPPSTFPLPIANHSGNPGSDRGPRPNGRDGRGRPDERLAPGGWNDYRNEQPRPRDAGRRRSPSPRRYDDRRRSPSPRKDEDAYDRRRSTSPRRDGGSRRSASPAPKEDRNGDAAKENDHKENGDGQRDSRDD